MPKEVQYGVKFRFHRSVCYLRLWVKLRNSFITFITQKEEQKMKTQKLLVLVIAVAAFLVVGASNATACCSSELSFWWVMGVHSAPDTITVESKQCNAAVFELQEKGFRFMAMTNTGTEHTQVLYFQQRPRMGNNNVALFCFLNIQSRFGDPPDLPGGPGGPGF